MKDMARPRKTIATTVGFDVKALKEITSKMSDNELGAWIRKAVLDCLNGCTAQDTDPFIKASYESARSKMLARQNIDAQKYQNNLARQGKTLAESATRTSEAVKALADGDIREDSLNIRTSDATKVVSTAGGDLESGTSAKTFVTTTEATTPCTISTDGPRQAEARQSRGTGSDSLRGTKQPESHSGKDSVLLPTEPKKPYGTCGHVMLTDAEGHTLRETYGKHLAIAIDILDAYGENNPKKFAKYKNHAAVLRKGNWVWNKVQEMILNEKRIENASKGPKNWKAQERERTARVLRGESADGSNIVRDEDLTPEELEAKYA